jgi:hypothetical protein
VSVERLKLENELLLTKSKAQMINLYLDKLEEIEELKAEIKELNDSSVWWTNRFNAVERDNREYRARIDKAIEYIKANKIFDDIEVARVIDKYEKILLNILQGSDKE